MKAPVLLGCSDLGSILKLDQFALGPQMVRRNLREVSHADFAAASNRLDVRAGGQTARLAAVCRLCGIPHKRHSHAVNYVRQTYLGHSSIADTAYYLHLTAESLPEITARVQRVIGDVVPPMTRGDVVG